MVGPGGRLLIGVDLKKDPGAPGCRLQRCARRDGAFNRNLLARINRELDADFDLTRLRPPSVLQRGTGQGRDASGGQLAPQRVRIDGRRFEFRRGESLHTENSYKYSVEEFQRPGGTGRAMSANRVWQDEQNLFSLHCLRVA